MVIDKEWKSLSSRIYENLNINGEFIERISDYDEYIPCLEKTLKMVLEKLKPTINNEDSINISARKDMMIIFINLSNPNFFRENNTEFLSLSNESFDSILSTFKKINIK